MAVAEKIKKRLLLIDRSGLKRIVFTAAAIMGCSLSLWAKADDAIPYPGGYRQWTHVKSTIIGPKHPAYAQIGGIQHIYANEIALEGYRTGRFPEGSILIYDFLETRENDKAPGVTNEGPRRFTSVMVKASKRYAETGGWGYEEFRGDSQTDRMVAQEAATKCFACHASQKERDYVFSTYRK